MSFVHSLLLLLAFVLFHNLSFAAPEKPPVIDMHLHAWPMGKDGPPDIPKNKAKMEKVLKSMRDNNVVYAATSGPDAFLSYWKAQAPERLGLGPIFPCIDGLNPLFFRFECFSNGENFPDVKWLEEQYTSGRYEVMGEMYNQYAGVAYDDARMFPYYELAQRLGIPVLFHTHSAPPLTAKRCCPEFRISNGHPLLLEEVLVKFPKLKVMIYHGNPLIYPRLLDLMAQFPKVHVGLTPYQRLPKERFHNILKQFKDAGKLNRVMFGSDGDNYEKAIAAYTSAEFLSRRELDSILCENAGRFLGKPQLCE